MSNLWLPEATPPQVSDEARLTVLERVLAVGIGETERQGLALIQAKHEPLAVYLDRFGFSLNNVSAEGLWPERVLKIGASLSALAYQESGYFQTVDDEALAVGTMIAEIDGIPDVYELSLCTDGGLLELVDAVHDAPDFATDQGGYAQILYIGAGCTRHFMQQAIAA